MTVTEKDPKTALQVIADLPPLLPDLQVQMRYVALALDISGSMIPEEFPMFVAEMRAILRRLEVNHVRLMYFDDQLRRDRALKQHEGFPPVDSFGRGGTDYCSVFDRLLRVPPGPAGVFILTDTYGTFPKEVPPWPVFWVTTTEEPRVPFGHVLRFHPEDGGSMELV